MALYAKKQRSPKSTAAQRIASAVTSRRKGAPVQRRHAAASRAGNTPKQGGR